MSNIVVAEDPPVPTLSRDFPDGEPRVRDIDLAVFYGAASPPDIRKVIKANLDELTVFTPICTRPIKHEGPGRPGTEFWLDAYQAQALVGRMCTREAKFARKNVREVYGDIFEPQVKL